MNPLTWQNPEQLFVAQVLKKIFYNSVAELRIIIPQHIIHIKECSSDFEMKVMHILPDFLCALPITPDFNLLKQTASTPCLQLQEKDSEEIITHSFSKHKYTQLLTRNNAFNF